ncbi:hypothetical protein HAX54_027503, partial [Datura stramonium]|nr:hypothetical protein [Datura stramonium]
RLGVSGGPLSRVYFPGVRLGRDSGKGSFPLSVVAHDSKKQSSQCESASSHQDCCWRKVRSRSNKSGEANLTVLEIHVSVDSPSRTFTIFFKESNCHGALSRGGSQESGESVSSPNPIKSSPKDCASSLKEEVQVILEEMDGKDMDVSSLMKLLKSFFELVAIYDQARSTLHDKDMEATRKELSIAVGERLSNSIFKE